MKFLQLLMIAIPLFGSCVAMAGLEFFPEHWSSVNVQKFRLKINTRVEQNLKIRQRIKQGHKENYLNYFDVEKQAACEDFNSDSLSGYEKICLIQEQIRLEKMKVDNPQLATPELTKLLQTVTHQCTFHHTLSDVPTGDFHRKVEAINQAMDLPLEDLAKSNYLHTITGGIESPVYHMTGINFDFIMDAVNIEHHRITNNGEISTPKNFGRVTGVDDLSSPQLKNKGFQLFRDIFKAFYGDIWVWAALKVSKEDLKVDLLTGRLDKACRRAATVQRILDLVGYKSGATQNYSSKYYRSFYAELAWLLASTAQDMSAAKDLNFRYLKLDDTKGTPFDQEAKKLINDLIFTSGRFMTVQDAFGMLRFYAFIEHMLNKMRRGKPQTQSEQDRTDDVMKIVTDFINCEFRQSNKPTMGALTLQDLFNNTRVNGYGVADIWQKLREEMKTSFESAFIPTRITSQQLNVFDDVVDAYVHLDEITDGFYEELDQLPASVFIQSQNDTRDGEFTNCCFLCATHNNSLWINSAYGKRWCHNLWILSGGDLSCLSDFVASGDTLLADCYLNYGKLHQWDKLLHRNQVVFEHSQGQNTMNLLENNVFERTLSDNTVVSFQTFIQSGKIKDKIAANVDRFNPVLPNRFFYNQSNSHFIGVAPQRDHDDVLQLATPQQQMTLLTEKPNSVLNWLYYLLYGTPFTHGTVDKNGNWWSLQPEKPDYKELSPKSDRQRKLWEARFYNE